MSRFSKADVEALRNSGWFDERWYLEQYPDVRALGMDPVEHYLWLGARMGRKPSPSFDAAAYLAANPDIIRAGVNPFLHYIRHGRNEGRAGAAGLPPISPGNYNGASLSSGALPAELTPSSPISVATDPNASTYTKLRPYPFAPREWLEQVGSAYLSRRSATPAITVFTAITGSYDAVNQHEHLMEGADYVLFSDAPVAPYIYALRPAPYHDEDPVRMARFVKTHPHRLIPDRLIAVWIDGNILVRSDLSELIAAFERSGKPVAAVPHPLRRSVYEEAAECVKRGKDDGAAIEEQMRRYRSEGFECDDLVESNFMMFRLDHPTLAPFLDGWWAEIEKGSRRDQLSFNYALRRAGGSYFALTTRPDSVRNHSALALFHHGTNQPPEVVPSLLPTRTRRNYADVMETRLAVQRDRRADVVVCVYNALDVVILCLESVAATRDSSRHRVVIVNDGSDEPTSAWLEAFAMSHDNVLLIRHAQAGGYTRAANAGLSVMDADMAILLNSDTIVAGCWIEKMLDAAFSNPGVGIVGPLSSAASTQSIPDHKSTADQTAINDMPLGYSVADMNRWCEKNTPADFLPRVPLVHGFCYGLTRDVVAAVGRFDEQSFPHGYGEENDYCFRAANAGFGLVIATHTYIYHKKSQSYQDERRTILMKNGNMKIRELHGKERVLRAVRSMQGNPHLVRMRELAAGLYKTFPVNGGE